MEKIDFKKTLKQFYAPGSKEFELITVPPMRFLMIDGHGDPNTAPLYQQTVETLYAVAYAVKFASKDRLSRDYTVPPLEGLWWAEDMDSFSIARDKSQWDWTMMIMTPDFIDEATYAAAMLKVAKKSPPLLANLRLETYDEGLSFQIMHIGSYDDEAPTLHRLHHDVIPREGYEPSGKHHEIYLSDPRKTAPEKLKTILRQPVVKSSASSSKEK